ncbi:acyl-CoA dehydrogenase [Pseudokordiimonas caeni]|uniref:acyl-CoA dehydrogenase n=1 Tax=Pseudokordiimonas caeni TaxID=2997908 RepID=UPI0028127413|nr:acyl-CoA dehydrogenase [Pseudokordiimonas caeni]
MPHIFSSRDLDFQLKEVLNVEELTGWPAFEGHDTETFDAMIETAAKMAEDLFQPHAAKADANEPTFDGKTVSMIPETKVALDAYVEAGFMGAGFAEEHGGLGLPTTVTRAVGFIFNAANVGTSAYPFLTVGAGNLLAAHATEDQKERFLKPMVEGRWFGTMCLSEPQAGSSLADIRTRAEPQADGTYRLFGNKMWISGGEQELSENIVHLVLAKIPGGPAGVKGISLFIVPKRLVNEDGSVGERNDVKLAGLNHKMGYRGTTNTLLNFGEAGGAVGYLVGEANKGLAYMFHMMNEARIGVGMGAVSLGYTGYLHALDYARGRPQGRPLDGKDPTAPMVPIVEHADVKRMLLASKSYVEGGLALGLYASRLVDEEHFHPDAARRAEATDLLDILTPIVKSWPSDYCLKANDIAIQVHGGYGYTRDYPVERLYRDNRLNPIHEGTKGIQGLDILGRKVPMNGGRSLKALVARMTDTITEAKSVPSLKEHAATLEALIAKMGATTAALMQAMGTQGPGRALANASLYLDALGHITVGWMWLKQALVAEKALANGASDAGFYEGKLAACRYFFTYELNTIPAQCDTLAMVDDTNVVMQDGWF